VRVVGFFSLFYGAVTVIGLAPLGLFGWFVAGAYSGRVNPSSYVLPYVAASGFLIGLAIMFVGWRAVRGRSLRAAPVVGLAWVAHHALVAHLLVVMGREAEESLRAAGSDQSKWTQWIVAIVIVVVVGLAHAATLARAARTGPSR